MSIFGRQTPAPTKINTVQINQSVLGFPVPKGWGRFKIQQSILWADGFESHKVSAGGKGLGGKDSSQEDYTADVIVALCAGPIVGIGDVWCGQSWLANTDTDEVWTVPSGTYPSITPANAANMTADLGVSLSQSYSATVTDLGSGATNTISGTADAPLTRVPYVHTGTLASGTYSVDSSNNYYFSTADIGKTVRVSYSFSLAYVQKQIVALVPSSQQIQVGGSIPFYADVAVTYYTGPNNGQALTRISGSGTPSTAGQYTVSGSAPAAYKFAAGDVGKEILITFKLNNSNAIPAGTQKSLAFTLADGFAGQSPYALLTSDFPDAALGYTGMATLLYAPMDLGFAANIQQNVFEVITGDAWGGGIYDCNPILCILDVLTNKAWGLGGEPVPFPISAIDNGPSGTWGPGKPAGATIQQDSTASSWFAANGFFISPKIDHQDSAASQMSLWLEAGQCAGFMSEGLLKLVPYGDTTTAGYGAVWIGPQTFATALDDTCFIVKGKNQDPVKLATPTEWPNAWNIVNVLWLNRQTQYSPEPTQESDQAAINRYGKRAEDAQNWDFITTLQAATFAANMRLKRSVYVRNTYEFSTSYRYAYLEPMDIVYITTSSQWAAGLNNENLDVVNLPVRITKVIDNPDGTLDFTAEDYPFGAHQPTIYNKGIAAGQRQPNLFADPGNTDAVCIVAPPILAGYHLNQLWIGAGGESDQWGGCNVWASRDGSSYDYLGTINQRARCGTLGSNMGAVADPDTTSTMLVELIDNSPPLESATAADADAGITLCAVGGELIAYSTCVINGPDQFTCSGYLRRGQKGTVPAVHAIGTEFLRLDSAVWKYDFDPNWAGQTIYLKLQSFNIFGNSAQDLADVTAITFVPFVTAPGAIQEFGNTEVTNTWPAPHAWLPPHVPPAWTLF